MTVHFTTPRSAARWAGAGYLALFVLAIFANFLALGSVLDPSDATATAAALAEGETTFRLGAAAFLVIFLLDIAIAWALFVLFRDVQRDLSLVSAWFRLGYTLVLGVALVFLFRALELVGNAPDTSVLLALQSFDFLFVAGLSAFGVHLVLMGRLMLLADRAPRVIGWLLIVAGSAYVLDTVAHIVLADYQQYAGLFLALVAAPSVIGELSLTVWLLLVATGRRAAPSRATATEQPGPDRLDRRGVTVDR